MSALTAIEKRIEQMQETMKRAARSNSLTTKYDAANLVRVYAADLSEMANDAMTKIMREIARRQS